jgi:hypothetical protein
VPSFSDSEQRWSFRKEWRGSCGLDPHDGHLASRAALIQTQPLACVHVLNLVSNVSLVHLDRAAPHLATSDARFGAAVSSSTPGVHGSRASTASRPSRGMPSTLSHAQSLLSFTISVSLDESKRS